MAQLRAALAAAERREEAARHELQHRVRNLMNVIQSVFRQTREGSASQDEFAEHFGGRLGAIARFHLGAAADDGFALDLDEMVRDELFAVACQEGPDCIIDGPPVRLDGRRLEFMGLALHELGTNAVKFGALANGGAIAVTWTLDRVAHGTLLRLTWAETGVPMLSVAPRPSGFGRQLIEEALPYQLDAAVTFDLRPGGLHCTIALPLAADPPHLRVAAADEPTDDATLTSSWE